MADLHEPAVGAEAEGELPDAERGIGRRDERVGVMATKCGQDIGASVAGAQCGKQPEGDSEIFIGIGSGLGLMRERDALVDN